MHVPRPQYAFGPFLLDPSERRLLREGTVERLTPKVFDVLVALVENRGRLVEKSELIEMVWPGVTVEDANLTQTIATLRKVLGEKPSERQYIETVPKRGYRFVADVKSSLADVKPFLVDERKPWAEDQGLLDHPRRLVVLALLATGAFVAVFSWMSQSRAMTKRASSSMDAFESVLRGRAHLAKAGSGTVRHEESQIKHEMARQLFTRAIQLDSNFADAYGWLAFVMYQQFHDGDAGKPVLESATANANHALQLDPQNSIARRALIHIYHSTGQTRAGLRQAKLALQAGSDDPEALKAAAMAYFRAGLLDRAIPAFARAIATDPFDAASRAELARCYLYSSEYRKGIDVVSPLLVQRQGGEWVAMLLYSRLGQWNEAIDIGTRYLRGSPDDCVGWLDLGRVYAAANRTAEANQTWAEGSRRMEGKLKIVDNLRNRVFLSAMYAELGNPGLALDHLRTVLSKNSNDPWTLFFAGSIHAVLGNRRTALDLLKSALDHDFLAIYYLNSDATPTGTPYRLGNDPEFQNLRATLAGKVEALRVQY